MPSIWLPHSSSSPDIILPKSGWIHKPARQIEINFIHHVLHPRSGDGWTGCQFRVGLDYQAQAILECDTTHANQLTAQYRRTEQPVTCALRSGDFLFDVPTAQIGET